jgi:hypothetical protein
MTPISEEMAAKKPSEAEERLENAGLTHGSKPFNLLK